MRGPRARLIACTAGVTAALVVASASATTTHPSVTLQVPAGSLHAGQQVSATLVNNTGSKLELGLCPTLARDVNGRWVAITHTHGRLVACPHPDPVFAEVKPHTRHRSYVELYDDLVPGTYRVTLPYRRGGRNPAEPPLAASAPTVVVEFQVTSFDPGPAPQLSEGRLLAIALAAARTEGDGHPTLIQHAEGSRLVAELIRTGDLVYAWNWSYLIAERGTFETPVITSPPGGPTGPGPVRLKYSVIIIVVNARTGQVIDGGSSDRYPDLAGLGPVSTDRG